MLNVGAGGAYFKVHPINASHLRQQPIKLFEIVTGAGAKCDIPQI